MQKLLKLLSESTNGRFKSEQDLMVCIEFRWYCRNFIEWLVENDKIDFAKLEIWLLRYGIPEDTLWFYEWLLMLLSISDTPIDDLISYLK